MPIMSLKLNDIQLCFQHIIMSGHATSTSTTFVTEDNEAFQFESLIIGRNTDDKLLRLNVYVHGYYQRLMECLETDLPTLKMFLGDEVFKHFAFSYIKKYPSQSYSLVDLSTSFEQFLGTSQPDFSVLTEEEIRIYELPLELLKLEKIRNKVYFSKGLEGIEKFDDKQSDIIAVNPSVEIVKLKFSLLDFFQQLTAGNEELDLPEYQDTIVLVYRLNYRLRYHQLAQWEFEVIQAIQHGKRFSQLNKFEQNLIVQLLKSKIIYKPLIN